ncbi:MAG: hypothetical protein HYS05_22115 [Acidobacteria bacterium]|nr:hypothetical protein [Acidobacteriota bacterium]
MTAPRPTIEELRDEALRARRVRFIVDFTSSVIMQHQPRRAEAEELVEAARDNILRLFPGREQTYDLIYAPRFRRLLEEFSRSDDRPDPRADAFSVELQRSAVVPFRSRPQG